jgi:hypothetical protein
MQPRAPILSSVAIDRFIRRVVMEQGAWAVAGEEGLARVASPTFKGRVTTLLWSQVCEAGQWGPRVAEHPRLKRLSLGDLYVDVLPRLAELERLVGPDWSAEPIEPEIEPGALARRLREEAVDMFLRHAACFGSIWVLQGVEGPACLMSKTQPGTQILPCWSDRAHAEARIAGPLGEAVAAEVPLQVFCSKTLTWVAETDRLVAPAFCEGPGLVEFAALELAGRLQHKARAAGAGVA